MTSEYKNYLLSEITKADEAFKKAMAENRFDDAYIYGKRASDLSEIYYYHAYRFQEG